jgi:predicted dehydrogenase
MGAKHLSIIKGFSETENVAVVAVCDVFEKFKCQAQEKAGIVESQVYGDYRRLLENKDIDVVVIATPDHWHARMAIEAMEAGKHIYVEKPMTLTIAEGKTLCDAAKKSGKLVMVGSQNKTSTMTAKAREVVKSGALGKINMVRMLNHRNNPEGAWVYAIPPDASKKRVRGVGIPLTQNTP